MSHKVSRSYDPRVSIYFKLEKPMSFFTLYLMKFNFQSMKFNPNYAEMFRSRPNRFVLPMKLELGTKKNENLVVLEGTTAKACYLENGDILVEPEEICDIGCETPRINYENYLGKCFETIDMNLRFDSFLGKPYRYFYAISSDVDSEKSGCVSILSFIWLLHLLLK